jgi:recombination protein RecA
MDRELTVLEKSLMENINKKFGQNNPMVQLKDDAEYGRPRGWIDTGVYSINWLISGDLHGGWPVGRISELDGDPGTGKTLLCETAMKDPTIDLIIYFDTEAAMNMDFLKFLGVDPSKVLYQPIDTVEQLQDVCEEVLNTIIANKQGNKKILMIVDSIALASTEKEMNPEGGSDMGYKARELRSFLRKYARRIEKYNIALLVTNHYTQKIGVVYGPNKTTTGGTALPYAASVRLDLKIEELEIDKKLEAIGASSVTLKATTIKNRCFSPRRRVTFVLDFERGVHRFSGLFKILLDYGIAKKASAWCTLPSWDPEQKFYAKDFADIVEKNNLLPKIQELLTEAVKSGTDEKNIAIESEVMDEVIEKESALERTTESFKKSRGKKE